MQLDEFWGGHEDSEAVKHMMRQLFFQGCDQISVFSAAPFLNIIAHSLNSRLITTMGFQQKHSVSSTGEEPSRLGSKPVTTSKFSFLTF